MRTASIVPFPFRDDQYRIQDRKQRFREFEKPRRFALESLEPRLLLSSDAAIAASLLLDALDAGLPASSESGGANSIRAALEGAGSGWTVPAQSMYVDPAIPQPQEALITQGLQGLSNWLDTLGDFNALSQVLPFVNKSVGDLLDLGGLIEEKLLTPVQTFFGADADQLTETEDLRVVIENLAETIGSVTGGFNAASNTVEYNLSFSANRSLNIPIDLGSAAELLGISVDSATSPTVAATGTVTFGFTFGIRLEPGLAPSEAFFITPGTPLAATLAIAVNNGTGFDLDLGFVDAAVGTWTATLNASISATITDSDTSDPLTLAELAGTPLSTLATFTTGPSTGALDVKLPVSVSLGGFSASGDVRITDANLFDATAPSVNVFQTNTTTPHEDLLNFTRVQSGDILGVFDGLGNALQYASNALDTPIPLIGGTINELLEFGDVVDSLVDPLFDVALTSSLHVTSPNLSGDAHFSVSLDGGVANPITIVDNNRATLADLVTLDITPALAPLGLAARVVAGDQIELFATNAAIRSFQLSGVSDSDPASTQLGLQNGQQSDLLFKFRTVQDLMSLLGLTGLNYNGTSNVLTFDLEFSKEFQRELPVDFAEGLGPLTVGGSFSATASVGAGFDLTLNFDLTPVSTTLTNTSMLSALGVQILPTITASGDAPNQGKLAADSSFTIDLNGTPIPLTLLKTTTDDNLLRSQLVDDLNDLFGNTVTNSIQAGTHLSDFVSATLLGTKLRLETKGSTPVGVLSLTITDANELGFGSGLQGGDADLLIRLRDGTSFSVNLDGAANLGNVITKIQDASNAGSGPRVTVVIPAADPTHLRLTDSTTGATVFAIQALNGSLSGAQLGILGTDIDNNGVIDGTPLSTDNLIDHFFISPGGGISASVDLLVDPIELSAALGLLQISVHDYGITDFESFLSIEVSAEATLDDPGAVPDSRITLKEITGLPLNQLGDLVNAPTITVAEFEGVFPLQVTAGGFDFGIDQGDTSTIPVITLSLNTPGNLSSGPKFETNQAFDDLLANLLDFDITDVINLVLGLINFLQDSDNPTLNTDLPLVNQSINDIFGFVDDLNDSVTGILAGIAEDALADAIDAIQAAIPGGLSTTQQNRFNSALSDLNDILQTLNAGGLNAGSGFDLLRDIIAAFQILDGALGDLGTVPAALQAAVDDLIGSVSVLNLADQVKSLILTALPASVSQADKDLLFEIHDEILHSVDDVFNDNPLANSSQKAVLLATKLVGLIGQLRDVIESFSLSATDLTTVTDFITDNVLPNLLSLEALGARLSNALGLPTDAITVELIDADSNSANMVVDRAIALQLHLEKTFSENIPLDFSLPGGFGPLSIETGGDLEITFGGSLDLGFAISLNDGDIFILDSSQFSLTAEMEVDDLTAGVKIGGVGVDFGTDADPGTVFLNKTGLAGGDPAALSISIDDTPDAGDDGAIPLSSVGNELNFSGVQGLLSAKIPVYVLGVKVGTNGITASVNLSNGATAFNVDFNPADILTGLLDLSMLIQFLPQLLGFLGDGLQSDLIGNLPIVGDELNAIGTVIEDFNDGIVTPLTNQINAHKAEYEQGGAQIEAVEDFIQEALFNAIGPGGSGILKLDPQTDSTGAPGQFTGDGTQTSFDPGVGPETGGSYFVTLDADGPGGNDPVVQEEGTDYTVSGTAVVFNAAPANGADIVVEFLDFQDVAFALTADDATLDLHLADEVTESSPAFNLGLDGLLLEGSVNNGGVDVTLGYDIRFGFGISKAAGFFIRLPEDDAATTDVDEGHEAELSLAVSLADNTEISARLFFVELIATQHNSIGTTGFSGTAILDLVDADNILTLDQFSNFTSIIGGDTGIEGDADVHLDLALGVSGTDETMPKATSALEVEWGFHSNDLFGETPVVRLNDITLSLGSFLSRALGPALDGLNDFLAPIRPILEILDTEIPLVSQLSQLFGGDEVTFLDAIGLFGEGAETVGEFLEILIAIDEFVQAFTALENGDIGILFGTLHFNNANTYDLRDAGAALSALEGDQANVLSDTFASLAEVLGLAGDEGGGLLESLSELGIIFPIFENPLPLLRALLGSEETIDLVQWDIPKIEAGFTLEIPPLGPILPPVPLFIVFSGGANVEVDFSLGLDTRGLLDTGNFLDGIYFGDFENIATGPEKHEVTLGVEIAATAELNVVVASAGVTGGVRAEVFADWHDEATPGKVYLDEIFANLQRGIECIFDLGGALKAFLEAFVKIGFDTPFGFVTLFEDELSLAEITLLDFSLACPPLGPPVLAHVSDGSGADDTVNGTVIPTGTLILHLGPFAGLRQPGYSSDGDEILLVRGEEDIAGDGISLTEDLNGDGKISEDELGDDLDGDGVLEADVIGLLGFEIFELHTGVTRIYGDAGVGDDSVIFSFVGNIPSTLFGGPGADTVTGGAGADGISGGNDSLPGFSGVASFSGAVAGSDAEDQLTGNAGNDTMKGGDGPDVIFGNAGADSIIAGAGNDTVHGGSNDGTEVGDLGDYIEGNSGDDNIRSHIGNDTVFAGAGNDQVRGGLGNDELHGDSEQDLIEGGADADKVFGDGGDDLLFGEGADVNPGAGGNDTVFGGAGNDTIKDAEAGPNDPNGDGTGQDLFYGDGDGTTYIVPLASQGPDLLVGGVDNDRLFGNGGDELRPTDTGFALFGDTLEGGSGDDYLEGGAGNDTVLGGAGTDRMIGGAGGSTFGVLGGTFMLGSATHHFPGLETGLDGSDSMVGSSGNDVMLGDNGTITGSAADVKTVATGGSGMDTVIGGGGNDVIFGGGRGDTLVGDGESGFFLPGDEPGNDIVVGDQGERTATQIVAQHSGEVNSGGNDSISGSNGIDTLLGGDGNDNIAGDNQIDYIVGDNGKVTLASSVVLRVETIDPAFGGNDIITGGNAADIALGGTGDDIVSGGNDGSADILLGDNGVVNFNDPAHPGEINDIFTRDPLNGGEDTMSGGLGDDTVVGGSGGNDLHPNGGDVLYGNQGNDVVIGDNVYITRDDSTAVVQKIETIDPDKGGDDFIDGSQGMDTLLGGFGDDTVMGGTQDDVLLGDNGLMEWLSNGRFGDITGLSDLIEDENAALFAKYSTAVADTDVTTLDLVTTANPTLGGRDLIVGGDGKDFAFGGTSVDTIYGDDGNVADLPEGAGNIENKDLLFGDHGRIYPQFSAPGVDVNSRNFFSIHMGNADGGDGDRMWGEEGADLLLGGQGDDRMFGGSGHDDMIGGHNVAGGFDELTTPAIVATINPPVNDVMDGGTGDDAMSGDNATIWRRADDISPRFRTTGTTIYSTTDDTITTNFGVDNQSDPLDAVGRDIRLLDHADATPAGLSGDDVMAGNAGHDTMFGELGNDLMQGDGFIGADDGVAATISRQIDFADSGSNPDTDQTVFFNIPEAVTTDGNDYMEGNGGNDFMYGNLGQDDMIGGSSDLFGLTTEVMRPDGSDVMFGGAAMDISRNNIGDATENMSTGVITTNTDGHAQDSDYMMGDNARVFRLVQPGTVDAFLTFAYDNYAGIKIIPRANVQLDYTLGGADYAGGTYTGGVANNDNGGSDLMHGESGDDFIFGMTASDVIFGEGQDDDIIGGYGNDWISGGTGQDGVIGDDGLIFTSRNGTAETLYNIAATTQSIISTSGQIQYAIINVTGELKKSVELVPFSYDSAWDATEDEFFGNFTNTPFADDAIFGGLGSDFLHGGSGDDAMSGGEALDHAYVPTYALNGTPNGILDLGYAVVGVPTTINPGDVLAFNPNDPDAPALPFAGEFDLFDEFDARRKVLLDSSGNLWKSAAQGAAFEFLLNFNEDEGVVRPAGQVTGGGRPLEYPAVHDDGRDVIFGDNGNDWLVGGTGRDDLWGGWGNDLMNADDDHTTNGNLNDAPDTHPTYEDRAYGGAGRDVLLSNTGGERLIDWVGEFNSYFVPFSPFGDPDVSRFLLPFLPEFLYALSKADGADQSQIRDFADGVTLRNGEPGGEIGLILQSDEAWNDQIGAPADPQPGTIPGGGRDVLWSADPTIPQGGSGQGLLTADPASSPSGNVSAITEDQMAAVANAAVQQWSSVLSGDQREALKTLQFALVAELPNDAVAWNVGDGLTLVDRYAAGRGWFVDSTPSSSGEFRGMDLLTALIHEIGHTLGYDHDDGGPMNATLASGQRELLIDWQANVKDLSATLGWNNHRQYQKPAFPEFTVDLGTPAPKKRLLADVETESDVTAPAEIDWYVEV